MIRWEDTTNEIGEEIHNLYFSHHYGDEKFICCLFKGESSGEWLYTSDLLRAVFEDLFCISDSSKIDLHDAKMEVQSLVYQHYEDEMKYYKEILDELDN